MSMPGLFLSISLLTTTMPSLAGEGDRFLPADTAIILRFHVRSLLEAPSLKDDKQALEKATQMLDRLLADYDSVRQHLTAAGIDMYRDVSVVTAAVPADGDPDKAFVIFHGAFDPVQFRQAAKDASRKADAGLKLIQLADRSACEIALAGRDEPLFACLLDKSTILGAGSKAKLTTALQLIDKDGAEPPKEAQAILKLLDAGQHLSFAGSRPAVAKLLDHGNLPLGELLLPIIQSSETVQCGLTFGKECELALRFGAKDEKSAKVFFQQTTLILAAARTMVASRAKEDKQFVPLMELMKGLRTSVEGKDVVWRSRLSLEATEKILGKLAK